MPNLLQDEPDDDEDEEEEGEEEESYRPSNNHHHQQQQQQQHRETKRVRQAKTNFSNALLRAGTKSTKDAMLDKPIRKMPGLLLETAGRSLMQKRSTDETSKSDANKVSGLSFGLVSSKISFGLYEGHLPVDHSRYTRSSDDGGESDSGHETSTTTATVLTTTSR